MRCNFVQLLVYFFSHKSCSLSNRNYTPDRELNTVIRARALISPSHRFISDLYCIVLCFFVCVCVCVVRFWGFWLTLQFSASSFRGFYTRSYRFFYLILLRFSRVSFGFCGCRLV